MTNERHRLMKEIPQTKGQLQVSEAIVIVRDKSSYLAKIVEVLKDTVLKNCVELVLKTSQHSILFVDVEA